MLASERPANGRHPHGKLTGYASLTCRSVQGWPAATPDAVSDGLLCWRDHHP